MALLRVDEIGKLERIAHKEDRRVVADEIPIALFRIKLQRKAAHVALGIGRATLARDRREPRQHLGLLADRAKSAAREYREMSLVMVSVSVP